MYGGPNYGGGYHHTQSSSRPYQNPNQHGGGFPSGPHNGDPQLLQWFNAVDTDRSGSISVAELQAALVNGQHSFHHIISNRGLTDLGIIQETGQVSVPAQAHQRSSIVSRTIQLPLRLETHCFC